MADGPRPARLSCVPHRQCASHDATNTKTGSSELNASIGSRMEPVGKTTASREILRPRTVKGIVNKCAHIDRLVDYFQTLRVDCDQSGAFGGRPTAKMRTSCSLVILLAWPTPVVSSTRRTLPTGKRLAVLSPVVTSYSPRTVTNIWRRGVGCTTSPFQSDGTPTQ